MRLIVLAAVLHIAVIAHRIQQDDQRLHVREERKKRKTYDLVVEFPGGGKCRGFIENGRQGVHANLEGRQ
jgi:hypothetical protein